MILLNEKKCRDIYTNFQAELDIIKAFSDSVQQAGAKLEFYEYPCKGHLFTDTDLQDYNRDAAELLWERVLEFLRGI